MVLSLTFTVISRKIITKNDATSLTFTQKPEVAQVASNNANRINKSEMTYNSDED